MRRWRVLQHLWGAHRTRPGPLASCRSSAGCWRPCSCWEEQLLSQNQTWNQGRTEKLIQDIKGRRKTSLPTGFDWIVPCFVHQVSSSCFVVVQVLLELVVYWTRIILKKEEEKNISVSITADKQFNQFKKLVTCNTCQTQGLWSSEAHLIMSCGLRELQRYNIVLE